MSAIASGFAGHAPFRYATSVDGRIYGVNGIDPPFVWDGVAAAVRNWGMAAPPTLSLGATSGTGLTGTYFWKVTWYNANTNEYGEASNSVSATLTNQGQTINRPSIAGIDSQVTHWRIWRTTAGQASTYYLVNTLVISDTSEVDNMADSVAGSNAVLSNPLTGSLGRFRPNGKYPFIRQYKGRLVLYGSRIENTGTVELTNPATTVAGTGTFFRQSHVGQRLYAGTDAAFYTIATVTDTDTAALSANYGGITGAGKSFRIIPAEPSQVSWSLPDSEGFDSGATASVYPADGDMPTGMEIIGTSLILFKRSHAYLFDYGVDPDPIAGTGNISMVLSSRGLIRQECCVPVGRTAYCVDSQGVYEFDGVSEAVPIDMGIRRLFQPDDGISTDVRINRAYSNTWHGTYDQKSDMVVWFVTCGTETKPQTALCWSRERQRWTMHRFNNEITASCQGADSGGEYRAWVGDDNQWLWALAGTRQAEGNSSGTLLEGTATSSTNNTLTNSGAAWPTTEPKLRGVYVQIVAGTGAGQTRYINTNTATQITVGTNWSVNPDTTSQYVIGAIETKWRSAWLFFAPGKQQAKSVTIQFEPNAAGRTIQVRLFKDFEAAPVTDIRVSQEKDGITVPASVSTDGWATIDASHPTGHVELPLPVNACSCFSVEMRMFSVNEPVHARGYDLEGFALPQEFE